VITRTGKYGFPVSLLSEKTREGTSRAVGHSFAILIIIMLCTAGCILIEPDEPVAPTSYPQETVGADQVTATVSAPAPVASAMVAVRNITITRPILLKHYTESHFPEGIAASVASFTDPQTANTVNGHLRWKSQRARVNRSETDRIERTITDIDTAIRGTRLEEDMVLYSGVAGDVPFRILNESRYAGQGYVSGSFDPSVVYHTMAGNGRDRDGYVTMLVFPAKRGSYLLYINETQREVLLPRSMIWDLVSEEKVGRVTFTAGSVPRYRDDDIQNVRLLYMNPIT
jgi:hypothetical protein